MSAHFKIGRFSALAGVISLAMYFMQKQLNVRWDNSWYSLLVSLGSGFIIAWIMEAPLDFAKAIPPAWRKATASMQEHRRHSTENRQELRELANQHRRYVRWHILNTFSTSSWSMIMITAIVGGCYWIQVNDSIALTAEQLEAIKLLHIGIILAFGLIFLLYNLAIFRGDLERHHRADETDRQEEIQDDRECVLKWNCLTIWFYLIYLVIVNVLFFFSTIPAAVQGIFQALTPIPRFLGLFVANIYLLVHSDLRLMLAVDSCCGFLVGYYFGNPWAATAAGAAFGFFNYAIVLKRWLIRYEAVRVKVGHRL